MTRSILFTGVLLRALPIVLLSVGALAQDMKVKEYGYQTLDREPHDAQIFTQGFTIDEDYFFESSGHYGRSFLVRYSRSGEHRQKQDIPRDIFAEGITVLDDRLYLLSWKAGKAWALSKHTLEVEDEYRYSGEGWGLTHNGTHLILSDGSDLLRYYDTEFKLQKTLPVRVGDKPLPRLNELEYHEGVIWANVWYDDRIYSIDASSGRVRGFVDLQPLREEAALRSSESVVNGIAYDPVHDGFWVTGKYWRYRYLIRLNPPD
ncbi:glutaminyl-peptide cyclotransferase [Gilvimarinus sp. F26214L]|uniref:glutaminyl-peptide cyclotransferase n=1 Tax=Gilvimarinus sp. DZF01 TaxID=3461371 RepID=UPI004046032B